VREVYGCEHPCLQRVLSEVLPYEVDHGSMELDNLTGDVGEEYDEILDSLETRWGAERHDRLGPTFLTVPDRGMGCCRAGSSWARPAAPSRLSTA
jgi:hypothetical protein